MTTSLFTTTLAISFLVVATPHLLPCPVDNRAFADSNPDAFSGRRRRRMVPKEETCNDITSEERKQKLERQRRDEEWRAPKRECPVPKPGGLIGQVLGIKKEEDEEPSLQSQLNIVRRNTRANGEDDRR
jgi:cytochrome c oxidase assembly factor 2